MPPQLLPQGALCSRLEAFGLRSGCPESEHESSDTFLCGRGEPPLEISTILEDVDVSVAAQWIGALREAGEQLAVSLDAKWKELGRIRNLERDVAELKRQVWQLRDSQSVVVPITTLEPEPFDLLQQIPVVIQPTDDGYLATFFDANIGMTGDTKEESVANLRMLLVDVFDELEREEGQLGPHLVRQLAVLRSVMKRRA